MSFLIEFGENLKVEQKYSMFDLYPPLGDPNYDYLNVPVELMQARMLGYNPTRIYIKGCWYEVIPLHLLVRTKSSDDYYRFIYIQINYNTGEYYIGKVNRKRWKEIARYQGSGLLFTSKYEKHKDEFVRYFIAACDTQKETEELEAKIVDDELLKDKKCLNLVRGGGGTNVHYDKEKRSKRQKELMKAHPEYFQSMIKTAKEIYCSGPSFQLEKRNNSIRDTMDTDKYREMTRARILRWKEEHPDEYAKSRENNRIVQQDETVREKKRIGREKWIQEHPNEYEDNKKKVIAACHTPEAEKKRSESLKAFYRDKAEEAEKIKRKRSEASVEVCRKGVNMLDLETGGIIKSFSSQHEAARWLVEQGKAKNTNCVSSISAVCLKKPCTTGYGFRKKAYGYGWEFSEGVETN